MGAARGFGRGLRKGFSKDSNKGFKQGILRNRLELICRKLKKGKSAEQIAENLEENPETLQSIIDTAERFAPEYDMDSILQELDLSKM